MTTRSHVVSNEADAETVLRELWREPHRAGQEFGGLRHHGLSTPFLTCLDYVREFVTKVVANEPTRYALLTDDFDGKSTLAASVRNELAKHGCTAQVLDGNQSITFGKDFPSRCQTLIIDNLPATLEQRDKAAKRIAAYSGSIMLLTKSAQFNERCLDSFTSKHLLPSSDTRPLDKLCRLIGVIEEKSDGRFVEDKLTLQELLEYVPASVVYKFCQLVWGRTLRSIEQLADLVLDRIETARLGKIAQIDSEQLFFDMVKWLQHRDVEKPSAQRRLFVEGTTDRDLLLLAARLCTRSPKFEWFAGLDVHVMDGTSQIVKTIREQNPHPEYDLFLLDNDHDGQIAAEKLNKHGLSYILLPEKFARYPLESGGNIEIEDLLSNNCIDQFYVESMGRVPEAEFLYYKNGPLRRVQVSGPDKDALVDWLAENASLEDVERLLCLLGEIRQKFGLNLPAGLDIPRWRENLCAGSHGSCQLGRRALPWWPPPLTVSSQTEDDDK